MKKLNKILLAASMFVVGLNFTSAQSLLPQDSLERRVTPYVNTLTPKAPCRKAAKAGLILIGGGEVGPRRQRILHAHPDDHRILLPRCGAQLDTSRGSCAEQYVCSMLRLGFSGQHLQHFGRTCRGADFLTHRPPLGSPWRLLCGREALSGGRRPV